MDDEKLIHRLLYYALIEIRGYGYEIKHKGVWSLANLFHNTPAHLSQAKREEISYSDVLQLLKKKAIESGCERWLDDRISQIK